MLIAAAGEVPFEAVIDDIDRAPDDLPERGESEGANRQGWSYGRA